MLGMLKSPGRLLGTLRAHLRANGLMRVYGEPVAFCPLCGSTDLLPHSTHRVNEFTISLATCAECGLVMQSPRLSAQGIDELYRSDYRTEMAHDHRENLFKRGQRRGAYIKEFLDGSGVVVHGKRIAEVGCGLGGILQAFAEEGCDTVGCDVEESGPEFGRSRGLDTRRGQIDVLADVKQSRDIVILSHVLEHVTDPQAFLNQAADLLAPGGVLYIEVPGIENPRVAARAFGAQIGHLLYFNKHTVTAAIEKAGLIPGPSNDIVQILAARDRPAWTTAP